MNHIIKLTLRKMLRNKRQTFFRVGGLTIGLMAWFLLILFVHHQQSFDWYMPGSDRIYRVHSVPAANTDTWARSLMQVSEAAPSISEVESFTRFSHCKLGLIGINNQEFRQADILSVDDEFFRLFSVHVISGNPSDITLPNTVFITREVAEKYFGSQNPIGKQIDIKELQYVDSLGYYEVRGVVENSPLRSHLTYSFLLSQKGSLEGRYQALLSRKSQWAYHYFKLMEGTNPQNVEAKLVDYFNNSSLKNMPGPYEYRFSLMPLHEIYLNSQCRFELCENPVKGNLSFYTLIAWIILLVSLFNFVSQWLFSLLRQIQQMHTVVVLGAGMRSFTLQLLSDVMTFSIISIVLSLALAEAILPWLNSWLGIRFTISYTDSALFGTVLLVLLCGFVISVLMARLLFYGKHFKVKALSGISLGFGPGLFVRRHLMKLLVAVQLLVVAVLLTSTLFIHKQMRFIQAFPLGYNKNNLIVIENPNTNKSPQPFLQNILQNGAATSIGLSQHYFGYPLQSLPLGFVNLEGTAELAFVNYDFFKTMQITLLHDYSSPTADTISGWVINENLYRRLLAKYGTHDALMAEWISHISSNGRPLEPIIGICQNFNSQPLQQTIGDFAFIVSESPLTRRFIHIRPDGENPRRSLTLTAKTWEAFYPGKAFEYFFLDDKVAAQYKAEELLQKVLWLFAVLSFVLCGMSIITLSMYSAQMFTKEMGIRKVNGASTGQMVFKLQNEFIPWAILAMVLSVPFTKILLQPWFQSFAYRTDLSIWVFGVSGILVLLFTLLTMSWHAWSYARRNPVESLRYE